MRLTFFMLTPDLQCSVQKKLRTSKNLEPRRDFIGSESKLRRPINDIEASRSR